MHILITGATGVAGSQTLIQALADPSVTRVTALVRSPLSQTHPKLTTLIHTDFHDYRTQRERFASVDACIWCLGIAQSLVSEAEYAVITYDYTLAAATALHTANPDVVFVFLSGMGADTTEKSRTLFARVKGKTENALRSLGFKHLVIARPGGIRPTSPRKAGAWYEKLVYPLYPILETLLPSFFISAPLLGKALVSVAKKQAAPFQVLDNAALKSVGHSHKPS